MNQEEKKKSWMSAVTVVIMMFVSIETLIFGTNENGLVELIGYGIIFLLTCVYLYNGFFREPKIGINGKLLFLLFANLFAWAINSDFTIKYSYACMIILLAYLVSKTISFSRFSELFRKAMLFIAIASLVGVLLHEFALPLVERFPITTNEVGVKYYNFLVTLVPQDRLWVYFRSYGVFREPGVFAFYLILATVFELFDKEKPPRVSFIASYLAALLFTYSTAGYLVALVVLITYLFKPTQEKKEFTLKACLLVAVVAALIVVFNNDHFYNRILSKTETENNSSVSRLASISLNLSMAFRDPLHALFGNGFTYVDTNYVEMGKELYHSTLHNTNTSLKMLAVYGVGYFGIFLFGLCKFISKITKGILPFLGILIGFILILSNEDILLNILLYVFIFYGEQIGKEKQTLSPLSQNPTSLTKGAL